jgi:hypothetical protein
LAAKALTSKSASARRRAYEERSGRYDFRVFLLGLGFIGDEFATARLHLTKRLSGSAAWKGERPGRGPAGAPPASVSTSATETPSAGGDITGGDTRP